MPAMSSLDNLLKMYNRAPVPVQNFMVRAYGWVLHRRRYGPEHDRMLTYLMTSLKEDREQIKEVELKVLKETLEYAYKSVPYYRDLWKTIGFNPADVNSFSDFRQVPVTEKDALKEDPLRFVSETYDISKLYRGATSGTTGKAVTTYKDSGCYQRIWAFQSRQRKIWGISDKRARVSIGTRPIVPMRQQKPPFWRHDVTEDKWLFSNYHMSPKTLDCYLEKIAEIDPEEIIGFPSGIHLIASQTLKHGLKSINPSAVITLGETLSAKQRETIELAFNCKVLDQYGSAEVVCWVGQCRHGTYHINHEFGHLEALQGDQPVWGEPGDAVGTGFVNRAQVLIRYRLGDSVVLSKDSPLCPCGWKSEVVDQIVGRSDDVLYTPDGRAIGNLVIVLAKVEGITEGQLVQDEFNHLTINLVPEREPRIDSELVIRERIGKLFGKEMKVDFRWLDHVPRTSRGKFRYQLNLVKSRCRSGESANDA